MAMTSPSDTLGDAMARAALALDPPPTCGGCALVMHRSEVRAQRRTANHVGAATLPPVVLPTWKCGQCGRQQPRITP